MSNSLRILSIKLITSIHVGNLLQKFTAEHADFLVFGTKYLYEVFKYFIYFIKKTKICKTNCKNRFNYLIKIDLSLSLQYMDDQVSKSALQPPVEGASCCASSFNASCAPHNEWQGTQLSIIHKII